MALTVELKGIPELEKKLGKITAKATLQGLIVAAANELVDVTAPYPPAPAYGGSRWYERGKGGFWKRKDGSIGGPSPVSENLLNQWTVKPQSGNALIKNDASYAGFVHDKDKQVGFHAARGWRTVQGEFEKHSDDLTKHMAEAIEDIWRE